MTVYYNEIEPFCVEWLQNLIAEGLIPYGHVDGRSIVDVQPEDLRGYTSCHFFAGLGGWPYALRLAGWPDDHQAWTGSCPCQPFSVAGRRKGASDPRHLWPEWFRLIAKRRPPIVFGEQVTGAKLWVDGVRSDLERVGYAFGAAVLPACAVDAPHIRDRVWIVAHAECLGWERGERSPQGHVDVGEDAGRLEGNSRPLGSGEALDMAHAEREHGDRRGSGAGDDGGERRQEAELRGCQGSLAHPLGARPQERSGERGDDGAQRPATERGRDVGDADAEGRPQPQGTVAELGRRAGDAGKGGLGDAERATPQRQRGAGELLRASGEAGGEGHQRQRGGNTAAGPGEGHWSDAEWLWCEFDQRWRRTQPEVRLLASGLPNRVALLRAFGNAIVPQAAAEFIAAAREAIDGA